MPVFKDAQKMYETLGDVFRWALKDTELGSKMKEYEITFKFIVKEPEGLVWIGPDTVLTGKDADKDGVITMELSGDSAHQFWMKQLSLPVALATKKIKSKGPIPKVLKILPFLKPVYAKYPEFIKKHKIAV
jgi:hypothetical protein